MTAGAWLAMAGAALAQAPARDKAPWGALIDAVGAAEIVLRDVCLPGILEGRPIDQLAEYERLVAMPSSAANAGPSDRVWRLGSIRHVYAVAWADGSCSTYVNTGPAAELRQMAERVILARPEQFARGRSGLADGDRVQRTVYCARLGDERLVATITSPNGRAARGTQALASTVYRAKGWSPLCEPAAGT
jgi:hypothetical protein